MRNKLPVNLENRDLPNELYNVKVRNKGYSYGFVNIMYLTSLLITVASILTVMFVGK